MKKEKFEKLFESFVIKFIMIFMVMFGMFVSGVIILGSPTAAVLDIMFYALLVYIVGGTGEYYVKKKMFRKKK